MERYRAFTFTLNNYSDTEQAEIRSLSYQYLVYGREVGEKGTPHLQGYIYFKNAKTLGACIKYMPKRSHIEIAISDTAHNHKYCTKDGDFEEHGTRPMTAKEKGEMEVARYKRTWDLAKSGDFEEIDPDIRVRLYGTIKRIRFDYLPLPTSQVKMDFHWWYGPSGTCKSRTALRDNPDAYLKLKNKWWDGYTSQPCVIIEEWSPDEVPQLHQMLKKWCDHHPFAAEIKGGLTNLRPPKIIILSNYTMLACFGYDTEGVYKPLKRRLKVREFSWVDALKFRLDLLHKIV
jgi:hypothetical protein